MQAMHAADRDRTARLAGALYLIVVVTGIFGLAYVPAHLAGSGDAAQRILSHPALFRGGIAALLLEQGAFVLLPLILYRLLGAVHRGAATAMVALAWTSVPVSLVAVAWRLQALAWVGRGASAGTMRAAELVRTALDGYAQTLLVASLFWGLWLLPFGWLVLRCGFLPRTLGVLLAIGGCGYVVDVFGTVLSPGYPDSPFAGVVLLPAAAGEMLVCAWLLVFGARRGWRAPEPDQTA